MEETEQMIFGDFIKCWKIVDEKIVGWITYVKLSEIKEIIVDEKQEGACAFYLYKNKFFCSLITADKLLEAINSKR